MPIAASSTAPARHRFAGPLIGRQAQVRLLDEALDRVASGQFTVVEVCGEPGVGKTRMLSELATRAQRAGLLVCAGAGTEFEHSLPYGTYAEALRPVLELHRRGRRRGGHRATGGVRRRGPHLGG